MFNFFSGVKSPSPAIIEGWQKRYGSELAIFDVDGKKAYLRSPTKAEVSKITKKLVAGGKSINENQYLKKVMELCWLGGDKELMNNKNIIEENIRAWQTL